MAWADNLAESTTKQALTLTIHYFPNILQPFIRTLQLTRQFREAQKITNGTPSGQLINGRSEQSAPTDILDRDQ